MTTPSLTKSFDTSLVDIQRSFSSTETAPSETSVKENRPPLQQPRSRTFRDLSTEELYAQWAFTYDTDNNFLQAVDDNQTQAIIPRMLARRRSSNSPLKILDFGCGTGRTTVTLLQHCPAGTRIEAWDASAEMLEIARQKCTSQVQSGASINFQQVDFSTPESLPGGQTFDMIVSTLVLEHLDSSTFFTTISDLLSPGGIAFVTNMHPSMGTKSVAGFEDESQQRVIGKSYLHGVQESVVAARKAGLQAEIQDVMEVAVTAEMIDRGEVPERGRKWVGKKVWFGLVARK